MVILYVNATHLLILSIQEETVLQTVPKLLGGHVVQTAYGPTFTMVDEDHVDSQRMREDVEDFIFEVIYTQYDGLIIR